MKKNKHKINRHPSNHNGVHDGPLLMCLNSYLDSVYKDKSIRVERELEVKSAFLAGAQTARAIVTEAIKTDNKSERVGLYDAMISDMIKIHDQLVHIDMFREVLANKP